MDFRRVTVEDMAERVANREVSSRELVEASLARIEATNSQIGAFVALDPERSLSEATEVDRRVAVGEDLGPLAGIPIGVKDTEDAIGYVTTMGSRLFADGPPSKRDSILVQKLRQSGCVIMGKTNTPELAWKGDT